MNEPTPIDADQARALTAADLIAAFAATLVAEDKTDAANDRVAFDACQAVMDILRAEFQRRATIATATLTAPVVAALPDRDLITAYAVAWSMFNLAFDDDREADADRWLENGVDVLNDEMLDRAGLTVYRRKT